METFTYPFLPQSRVDLTNTDRSENTKPSTTEGIPQKSWNANRKKVASFGFSTFDVGMSYRELDGMLADRSTSEYFYDIEDRFTHLL